MAKSQFSDALLDQKAQLIGKFVLAIKEGNLTTADAIAKQTLTPDFYPDVIEYSVQEDINFFVGIFFKAQELFCNSGQYEDCISYTEITLSFANSEHVTLEQYDRLLSNVITRTFQKSPVDALNRLAHFNSPVQTKSSEYKNLLLKTLTARSIAAFDPNEGINILDKALGNRSKKNSLEHLWPDFEARITRLNLLESVGLSKQVLSELPALKKLSDTYLKSDHPTRIKIDISYAGYFGFDSESMASDLLGTALEGWKEGRLPPDTPFLAYLNTLRNMLNKKDYSEFDRVYASYESIEGLVVRGSEPDLLVRVLGPERLAEEKRYEEALELISTIEHSVDPRLDDTNIGLEALSKRRAFILQALGRYSEAINTLFSFREKLLKKYGLENPRVVRITFTLANLLALAGRRLGNQKDVVLKLRSEVHSALVKQGKAADLALLLEAKSYLVSSYELDSKDYKTAIKLAEEAISIIDNAEVDELLPMKFRALVTLARLYKLDSNLMGFSNAYQAAVELEQSLPSSQLSLTSLRELTRIKKDVNSTPSHGALDKRQQLLDRYLEAVKQQGPTSELAISSGLDFTWELSKGEFRGYEERDFIRKLFELSDSERLSIPLRLRVASRYILWNLIWRVANGEIQRAELDNQTLQLIALAKEVERKKDLSLRFRASMLSAYQEDLRFLSFPVASVDPKLGLALFEATKAGLLSERVWANRSISALIKFAPTKEVELRGLTRRLSMLYEALASKSYAPIEKQRIHSEIDSIETTLNSLTRVEARLKRKDEGQTISANVSFLDNLDEMIRSLPRGTSYISLIRQDDPNSVGTESRHMTSAFVVTPDRKIKFLHLGAISDDSIEIVRLGVIHGESLRRYLASIGKVAIYRENVGFRIVDHNAKLVNDRSIESHQEVLQIYQKMFGGLLALIKDADHVVFSTHGT
uniref:hypothetical protein n=1 Tax=Rheinheimera sp. TaxID=1869214 RepID=UPI004047A214